MIITAERFKSITAINETDDNIRMRAEAVESFICKYTNNEFTDKNGNKNYPPDVVSGAVKLMEWDFKNSDNVFVKSESLSRHSVTYSESYCESFCGGYPAALVSFLKPYIRCRF